MKSSSKKIFLVGLSVDFTKREVINYLSSTFETKNFFLEMKIKRNSKNVGWAVLHVKSRTLYEKILNKGSFELKGKSFFAKKYMDGNELQRFKEELHMRRIFVKGLPDSINDKEFREFFEVFGDLEDAYTIKDESCKERSSRSLGYGFLIFKRIEDALEIVKLNEIEIDGYLVKIEKYRSKQQRDQDQVGNTSKSYQNNYYNKSNFKKKNQYHTSSGDGLNDYDSKGTSIKHGSSQKEEIDESTLKSKRNTLYSNQKMIKKISLL